MSLYADYILEHRGDCTIENANGFATYRFLNNNATVYLVDIYVRPEARKSGAASDLADKVCEIARQKGAKELLGTVVPSARNSTASLKVLLGYGMELQSASADLIIFRKSLQER